MAFKVQSQTRDIKGCRNNQDNETSKQHERFTFSI